MRIATWNVNSIRTREPRVVDFLVQADVDVLAMQEIKCRPTQFPMAPFEEAGYEVIVHGLNQWNGVAIASRLPLTDVATELTGQPGFAKGHEGPDAPLEARALGATIDGVRVWSLYVPNGRALDDPHLDYKLRFLRAAADEARGWLSEHPDAPLALTCDFNVARPMPTGDRGFIPGCLIPHLTRPRRESFAGLEARRGSSDVVRPLVPEGFTFLDLQAVCGSPQRGLRIRLNPSGIERLLPILVVDARIEREHAQGWTDQRPRARLGRLAPDG